MKSGGCLHGNHQAIAEVGQRFFQPADIRGMAGIEHSQNIAFSETRGAGKRVGGQPFLA